MLHYLKPIKWRETIHPNYNIDVWYIFAKQYISYFTFSHMCQIILFGTDLITDLCAFHCLVLCDSSHYPLLHYFGPAGQRQATLITKLCPRTFFCFQKLELLEAAKKGALSYLRPHGPPPPDPCKFCTESGGGAPSSEMYKILWRISKDILHISEEGGSFCVH